MSQHRRGCVIFEKDFTNPLYLQALSRLSTKLRSTLPSAKFSNSILASICHNILSYMEAILGRDANPKSKLMRKLPAKLFKNVRVNGPLYFILLEALKYQIANAWATFNLFDGNLAENMTFLQSIENVLIEKQFIRRPRFYFNKVGISEETRVHNVIQSLNAIVVTSAEEATHIIDNSAEEKTDSSDVDMEGDGYVRTLDIRSENGGEILVHWWYFPDSYDEWVPMNDIEGIDPPSFQDQNVDSMVKQWHVSTRFLTDSALFNEWCNEQDYVIEVDENDRDLVDGINTSSNGNKSPKSRRSKSRKRVDVAKTKRENSIPGAILGSEKVMVDIPPPSMNTALPRVKIVDICDDNIRVIDIDQEYVPIDESQRKRFKSKRNAKSGNAGLLSSGNTTPNGVASGNNNVVSFPEWFAVDSVSTVEERYVFNEDMIKEDYIKLRNAIVTMYNQCPNMYLSATECRRKFSGNVSVILQLHEFLDVFGIINHSVKAEMRPQTSLQPSIPLLDNITPLVRIPQRSSHGHQWSPAMDAALLDAMLQTNGDWNRVAQIMHEFGVSQQECMVRFSSIPLSRSVETDDYGGITKSFASSCNGIERLETVLEALITKGRQVADSDTFHQIMLSLRDSIVPADTSDSKFLKEDHKTSRIVTEVNLSSKVEMFDEKINLLTQVESVLEQEREYLEAEKRRIMLQKARLGIHVPVVPTAGP